MNPNHPTKKEMARPQGCKPAAEETSLSVPEQVIRILVFGLAVAYSYLLLN